MEISDMAIKYDVLLKIASPVNSVFHVACDRTGDFGQNWEPVYPFNGPPTLEIYRNENCLQIVSEWMQRHPEAEFFYGNEQETAETFLLNIQAHPYIPAARECRRPEEVGGTHYQQGVKTSPWDLQREMKTSGSVFVDVRRADAIKYIFRMKGDTGKLLEDLKKGQHCISAAIAELEKTATLKK